jgi:hypothetical protein
MMQKYVFGPRVKESSDTKESFGPRVEDSFDAK